MPSFAVYFMYIFFSFAVFLFLCVSVHWELNPELLSKIFRGLENGLVVKSTAALSED